MIPLEEMPTPVDLHDLMSSNDELVYNSLQRRLVDAMNVRENWRFAQHALGAYFEKDFSVDKTMGVSPLVIQRLRNNLRACGYVSIHVGIQVGNGDLRVGFFCP
ncbi:hypothetical protein AVT69_gp320 [Pseudomonas phage PhiPA3]|uniref:Uncharacterized protein 322 n=1 Tax=Pseudomonas phage PhiPA3 TaxID=998086 RepID=F8SJF8_BPPA3|nr:hypothetical protein AVT69_gp320 [Pseudomonas phage PhiPA3]AEH03745.1 hypothetical protein [Pseudomonas phage PhiPA3]